MARKRITIKDVAKRAGVSTSTVSRVLNNSENVHHHTRQLVKKAFKELGYLRDPMATALKTRKSNCIQVLIDLLHGGFIPDIMLGIEQRAKEKGYRLLISKLDEDKGSLQNLDKSYIDGVIVISHYVHEIDLNEELIAEYNVPVVCVYSYTNHPSYPCVLPDDFQGAYLAVEHLAKMGYRRVAFINGIAHWPASRERLAGYRQAVVDYGLSDDPRLIQEGNWKREGGYQACMRLFKETNAEAIFAGNDTMAVGVMDALRDRGLRVPEDVALVGFDDKEFCDYVHPSLTSIAMPLQEMGEKALDIVISNMVKIENGCQPGSGIIKLPCQLKQRESTCLKS